MRQFQRLDQRAVLRDHAGEGWQGPCGVENAFDRFVEMRRDRRPEFPDLLARPGVDAVQRVTWFGATDGLGLRHNDRDSGLS